MRPTHGRRGRRGALIGVAVAILLLVYELLWGKLFPYSPVAVGFTKHELARSITYVQDGAGFADFARLDGVAPAVERAHGLRFVRKPRFFIFRDDASYLRRSPTKARFCAFYSGALIISPWAVLEAAEGKISLETYVRHELSHVLLFQHMGLLRAWRFPKWLLEGVATYTANQRGTTFYPSKEETYRLMREGNFVPPQAFHTMAEDRIELRVRYRESFIYSELACLVDYLIGMLGRDRFQAYLTRMMTDGDEGKVFQETYGVSFDEAVRGFRDQVLRGKSRKAEVPDEGA